MLLIQPLGGLCQVELDHLTGATPHQEQGADLRSALQELRDESIQLLIGIGQTRQVPLAKDGGAEAGFGKNHHPSCALDQMGAGAGAHHQEKGIRHAPMQPDDRGQTAKDLPLAAFLERWW